MFNSGCAVSVVSCKVSTSSIGRFEESAQCYAQTRVSFEEVTLKFIESKKEVALRVYLERKLESYSPVEVLPT